MNRNFRYRLDRAGNFIKFKNGKSIKPGGKGIYPVYGANGIIGMSDEYREENSVIIGRVGAYCGSVQFCRGRYWASDNTIVAFPKDNDTDVVFLYYVLKNANLNRWAGGAAQPLMTQTVIKQIELPHPNIYIQRKISSILSAYDDLIENNTRRIQILEEMAQRIYQEWFVNFRFPGYEKVRFVDSELGKIPEGWEVKLLKDYVDFIKGIEPGSKNYLEIQEDGTIPFLRVGDLNKRSSNIYIRREFSKGIILEEDDIAVSFDGTPGVVATAMYGCYSSGVRKLAIKNDAINKPFLYYLMKSEHIQGIIKAHSKGTTILHASESINYLNFVLPTKEIMKMFYDITNPLINEKILLLKKNKILRKKRDLLLPKLISGEIDVSNLDIAIRRQEE
jgi:type I restriction enzyme S subunit